MVVLSGGKEELRFWVLIMTRDHSPLSWSGRCVLHFPASSVNESGYVQVLRQGSFIRKIHNLGWTSPGYFEKREDAVALQYAIVRYHA
jgi:hypothetical protein